MSFREMLEQVKAGRADPECKAAVKAEIEKHEAIADYLAERFDEQFSDQEPPPSPETGRIARRVRFRLLGSACLAVLAVFLIASAAVLFCDLSYYNPNKGIEARYGGDGQFLLDMAAFTELHSPGYTASYAEAVHSGPGSYDLRIRQNDLFWGRELSSFDRLVRGKTVGSGGRTANEYWRFPVVNAFGYRQGLIVWVDENGVEHTEADPDALADCREALAALPPSSRAAVYVTFDHDLSLEEFDALLARYGEKVPDLYFAYAAVAARDGYQPGTLGFEPSGAGLVFENAPEEEFPCFELALHDDEMEENRPAVWEEHFHSLLRYLSGRPGFLEAMANVNGISPEYYQEALRYIDQNGIGIYGALVHGGARDILRLLEEEDIRDFYVENVKLSVLSR